MVIKIKINDILYAAILGSEIVDNFESAIIMPDEDMVKEEVKFMTKRNMPYYKDRNKIQIKKVRLVYDES